MADVTHLAPYAVSDLNSRGRQHEAEPSHDRSNFQRDYARILHSRAFRRLQGKTQVFSAGEGDLFRTRMSHSLEVEQLSRRIANQLHLNEDLCATLAIGHDIGHPPFGHMGQDVLNELMKDHGGFEHNHQALRLVDDIECAYTEHRGLNLMFETREGLLKHCSRERAKSLGEVAKRHLDGRSPPLELQVVDKADAIAYLHADLEDAFVRKILTVKDLKEAPGFMEAWAAVKFNPHLSHLTLPTDATFAPPSSAEDQRIGRATVLTVLRQMMSSSVADLVRTTRAILTETNPQSLDDIRAMDTAVCFSDTHAAKHKALKKFSRARIYEHPSVSEVRLKQAQALRELFAAYVADPSQMSGRGPEWGEMPEVHAMRHHQGPSNPALYRVVADHVAGMTDAYALAEHRRLKAQLAQKVEAAPASLVPPPAPAEASPRRQYRRR
jgi:dGTPase